MYDDPIYMYDVCVCVRARKLDCLVHGSSFRQQIQKFHTFDNQTNQIVRN